MLPVMESPVKPRRSPCGERGLKFLLPMVEVPSDESLPVRGAWVEMDATPSLTAP